MQAYVIKLWINQNSAKVASIFAAFCSFEPRRPIALWADGWKKRGWRRAKRAIKNLEIIRSTHAAYCPIKPKVQLTHVRGHAGTEGNEMADRMATFAVTKRQHKHCGATRAPYRRRGVRRLDLAYRCRQGEWMRCAVEPARPSPTAGGVG